MAASSVAQTHPKFDKFRDKWRKLRHAFEGQDTVKQHGVMYLPPTQGMVIDGVHTSDKSIGAKDYEAYLARAIFPELVSEAVELLLGIMHQKPATIEVPDGMSFILDAMSVEGEDAQTFLRKINAEQLTTGRCGLLVDLPPQETATPQPYIAFYAAESIRNWNDFANSATKDRKLDFVILDECGYKVDSSFSWDSVIQYRVCQILDGKYNQGVFGDADDIPDDYEPNLMKVPSIRGKSLEAIPFYFINSSDNSSDPEKPSLLALCNVAFAIYLGEADYRQNLHMQSQDTLVIVGGTQNPEGLPGEENAIRTGAGSRIEVDIDGDAKYIGVQATGLAGQKEALENDYSKANSKTGSILQSSSASSAESGVARTTRLTASTATLNQIAHTGAAGLQMALRAMATWLGLDETKVVVTPNVEFADFEIEGDQFVQLITASNMGFPISKKSMHALAVEKGMTTLSFEKEIDQIEEEMANTALNPQETNPNADPNANDPANTPTNQ